MDLLFGNSRQRELLTHVLFIKPEIVRNFIEMNEITAAQYLYLLLP
jgi:type II secretory pathway component GspD/PulD (secretin)